MNHVKLHLGCGKRFLAGYTHIDLSDFDHIDYQHKIDYLPFIDNDSVDLIYSSHAFEYFDRVEAESVLLEWKRVLKPGGTLRLAVPDFEALTNIYRETKNLDLILGPVYGRWPVPGGDIVVYHKTVYDFNSLKNILEKAGFYNIQTWDWEKVFVKDIEGFDDFSQAYYPHMDKTNGILLSLNVEALKI